MWLEEEDRMLACIWRQGCYLAGSLCKIVGSASIYCQSNLTLVIEDDGIAFLKAKWIDDRAALSATNAALSGSFYAASGPCCAASRTLLIHKGIVPKGGFVRHHR